MVNKRVFGKSIRTAAYLEQEGEVGAPFLDDLLAEGIRVFRNPRLERSGIGLKRTAILSGADQKGRSGIVSPHPKLRVGLIGIGNRARVQRKEPRDCRIRSSDPPIVVLDGALQSEDIALLRPQNSLGLHQVQRERKKKKKMMMNEKEVVGI